VDPEMFFINGSATADSAKPEPVLVCMCGEGGHYICGNCFLDFIIFLLPLYTSHYLVWLVFFLKKDVVISS
jgi:hypothetical protein